MEGDEFTVWGRRCLTLEMGDVRSEFYRYGLVHLSDDGVQALREVTVQRIYRRGQTILEPKYGLGGMFAVVSGGVLLYRRVGESKRVPVCHRRRKGDTFTLGQPGAMTRGETIGEAMRADTVVQSIAWTDIEALMAKQPAIALSVTAITRQSELDTEAFSAHLAASDAIARLMYVLAVLAQEYDDHLVRETQKDIAWQAVVCREQVSKGLPMLERRRLVEVRHHPRGILVPDPEQLLQEYRLRIV